MQTEEKTSGFEEGLDFLLDFSGRLLKCKTLDSIYRLTVETTRQRLCCRISSIFLFSKEGKLERRYLSGLGKEFPLEMYERGQGLVGRTAGSPTNFGKPHFSVDMQRDPRVQGDPKVSGYAEAYGQAIRARYCFEERAIYALAVPLNGLHRTFGVVHVVNKLDPATQHLSSTPFDERDLNWLIMMARLAANAVINIKKQNDLFILADTLQPRSEEKEEKEYLDRVAKTLTDELSVYFACLIHTFNRETKKLEIISSSQNFRRLPGVQRQDLRIPLGKGVSGLVFLTGRRKIVSNLNQDPEGFLVQEWVEYNNLVSLICLPLGYRRGGPKFGTLQLFTRYEYIFDDDNIHYLESVGNQISNVLRDLQEKKELKRINHFATQLNEENSWQGVLKATVRALPAILGFDRALAVISPPGSTYFEVIASSDNRQLGAKVNRDNPLLSRLETERKVRIIRVLKTNSLPKDLRDFLRSVTAVAILPIPAASYGLSISIVLENLRRADAPKGRLIDFYKDLKRLCETIASQVSSALRKNELLESLEVEFKRQMAIQRVIRKTSSTENSLTMSTLTVALQELIDTIDADVALLGLLSKESETLQPCLAYRSAKRRIEKIDLAVGGTLDDVLFELKSRCWTYESPESPVLGRVFTDVDLQSEIALPLVFHGQTIGALVLGNHKDIFDKNTIAFAETFASSIANTIQSHRFFTAALRLGTVRFEKMSKNRISAVLAEKTSEMMETPVTCVWLRRTLNNEELLVMRGSHGVEIADRSVFDMKRSQGGLSWEAILNAEHNISTENRDALMNPLHIVHDDIQIPGSKFRHPEFAWENDLKAMIIMPIVLGTQVLGVINTYARRRYQFFEREIYLLQNLALNGAMALSAADLTERLHEINEEILESAQIANPGTLALSFSHDISHSMSHLNALLSSLIDMVPKRLQDGSPGKDVIESLTASTDYLRDLIRSLVKYAGGKPVKYATASLKEIFEHLEYIYSVRLQSNRIEFPKPAIESGALWIECDRSQIEQTFINLLNNSIYAIRKRMSKGGRVTIFARNLNDDFVEIQFKDNGVGIAPDDLERIFDPFFTTKGSEGSGFGLPICRKIIEDNHRGSIWIKSRPHDYTTIFIKIPKHQTRKH